MERRRVVGMPSPCPMASRSYRNAVRRGWKVSATFALGGWNTMSYTARAKGLRKLISCSSGVPALQIQ